jgi:hypothetical protein
MPSYKIGQQNGVVAEVSTGVPTAAAPTMEVQYYSCQASKRLNNEDCDR